ncbi:3-hydroxybutyryl-CoA dehydrogenase [Niallia endozanthoxylica]|uniref:L-gulonate 3-dehydrogenase n=1 Tax=Niallia endozanthoxylica TaxID=2036016 RepID=A0A5J5HFI6_9BACI|nr:3-hydroxybutyryl-CoA dehydrogenase [Niallia endozanthoxylica]KAA9019529.1 3-hydroxybutyryl-CoA dehydrogenase [Niallia endozanthoxylica]
MKPTNAQIAVVGAGRMGRGISLAFAYQGYRVILIDMKDRNREAFLQLKEDALAEIKNQLDILVMTDVVSQSSVDNILGSIDFCSIQDGIHKLQQTDVLFEAVPEILDVKKSIFELIGAHLPENTIIASTTSSFSANDLAQYIEGKERYMNTHWLNPAYLIPLVEVSPANETSPEVLQKMKTLLEGIGKVPVTCAPSPGFIVPRIQALAMNEAARLVEEGVATAEDIDKASTIGFGLRFAILGLLEFIDWGGAETLYHASHYLKDSFEEDRFGPPQIIEEKMKKGETGMRAGKGFYDFDGKNMDEYQVETLRKFIDLLKHLGLLTSPEKKHSLL